MIFIIAIILLIVGIVLMKWNKIKPLLKAKSKDKKTIKKSSDAVAEVTAKVIRGFKPKIKPKVVGGLIMMGVPLIVGVSIITSVGQTIIQSTKATYNSTAMNASLDSANSLLGALPLVVIGGAVLLLIINVLMRGFAE